MRRYLYAGATVAFALLFVLGGSAAAMAADLEPSAGGAQPIGSAPWSDGLLKGIIIGVPAVLGLIMTLALVRGRGRS